MLLPIRPRSPVEEPLVDPIPEAACEAETKMQPPEEDLMVAPLDSSGSSRGSRGKRRSRRPSVQDDEKAAFAATKGSRRPSIAESDLVLCLQEGLQGLQDLQGLEPDVTPDADDTMTLEAQGRLQVRLGALDTLKLITGEELHDTTVALGLTSYSIEDMNQMLNTLADYIDLKFVTMESPKGKHRLGRGASGLFKHSTPPGPPSWEWPRPLPTRRISTIGRGSIQILEPNSRWNAIPFRALVEAFQRDEQELSRKVFTAPRMMVQFQAVKEILLAGDTNRLVAELTFVRINDLAAPPEKIDVLAYLEPLVFLTILGNGIMIGVQSDPEYYDWKGWWWMELVFALVLVAEFLLRLAVQGCYTHFRGPDRIWNLFDLLFITTAIVDLVLELVAQDSVGELSGDQEERLARRPGEVGHRSIGAIWQREGKAMKAKPSLSDRAVPLWEEFPVLENWVVGALLMGSPGPSAEAESNGRGGKPPIELRQVKKGEKQSVASLVKDQQKLRQLAEAQPAAAEADQVGPARKVGGRAPTVGESSSLFPAQLDASA
ncbi:Voltage-dependent L-type calcium channel subunit alpha-1S [Durusdinium trenchii]|uniref:Voltage-dependent L-type calcium channel subunit alpha-1S n=1 Tax=Durusdinium trenchii TaxID=1381693 RepID=A0ABP0RXU5_9DINO